MSIFSNFGNFEFKVASKTFSNGIQRNNSIEQDDDVSVFSRKKFEDTQDIDIINEAEFEDCEIGNHDIYSPYIDQEDELGFKVHTDAPEKDKINREKDVSDKGKFFVSDYEQHTDLIERGQDSTGSWYNFFRNFTTNPEITPEEAEHGMVKKTREQLPNPLGLIYSISDSHKDRFEYEDGSVLENIYYQGDLKSQKELTYKEGVDLNNLKTGDKRTIIERSYDEDGNYIERQYVETYEEGQGWFRPAVFSYNNNRVYEKAPDDIDLSKAEKVDSQWPYEPFYRMPDGKIYVVSPSGEIFERSDANADSFREVYIDASRNRLGY